MGGVREDGRDCEKMIRKGLGVTAGVKRDSMQNLGGVR